MSLKEITEQSLLIVAHPDDEALWFSSILEKVDLVIICLGDVDSTSRSGIGRNKSIAEHPVQPMRWLEIAEAGVFGHADWESPTLSKFGMRLNRVPRSEEKYKDNYYKIKAQLSEVIESYRNVFTHNPWGEYGHEEHVQLFRIVEQLQRKHHFNLWTSNYFSDRSYKLMQSQIPDTNLRYVTGKTNKKLAQRLMSLYLNNECWTWYSDYEWFNEESFLKFDTNRLVNNGDEIKNDEEGWARNVPLSYIKMKFPRSKSTTRKRRRTFIRRILS